MQRPARASLGCLLALGLLGALAPASGFSLSRTLHDVEQDMAEDANLYSQELRLGEASELVGELPADARKNHLEKYVTIKESPSSYVSLARGQRLELKCEVDGSPPPRVYWVMGENPGRQVEQLERESVADVPYTAIARELSRLTIDCVGPQDQSLMHCVGVSGDKIVISQPTVLNVEGGNSTCDTVASAPVITRHRPLYFSEIGSTVVLPCEAQGKPRPHVYWLDGEGNPLLDPRFVVQPNGNLVIANIRWQDMDGYKCVAKSSLGEAEAITFLYPAAKSESEKRKANAL
ncbi:neural/ectodermal development factor IMP-L2 isoform X2 [Phymastichus coffea]|nr:neural/ectodermal development factor IMP-L2 isoform X2 [Phymastichus coffea]